MRCYRCKKPLSDPESVRRGIGPICLRKVNFEAMMEKNDDTEYLPFTGDVVLMRLPNGKKQINVPRVMTRHSPTGLEWGYGGSGPADLALNILIQFAGVEFALRNYQDFKFKFVGAVPRDGGVIKREAIIEWIAERDSVLHMEQCQ